MLEKLNGLLKTQIFHQLFVISSSQELLLDNVAGVELKYLITAFAEMETDVQGTVKGITQTENGKSRFCFDSFCSYF